jgi:4-amino-4-deoxychorismate lyase
VLQGQPLFLDQHLQRLSAGAAALGFPLYEQDLYAMVHQLIEMNKLDSAGISVIMTRGVDKVRNHIPTAQQPTVLAFAYPWKSLALRRPITAALQDDPRPELYAHLKMTSLLPNVQASQKAVNNGFDKVIFHRHGIVLEAAQANIFWIRDERLYTPSLDLPLVAGITHGHVLQVAADLGLEVLQGHYPLEALKHADEVFLCASLSQITPIKKIQDWDYLFEPVLTRQIAQQYQQLCLQEAQSVEQRQLEQRAAFV